MLTAAISLGLFVGAVLGLTGAGGGILAVPALTLGLNIEISQAAPIALVAVGLGAAVGAVAGLRQGRVRYKAAVLMAASGALVSPLGVAAAQRLPSQVLSIMFAAIMFWVAYRMFQRPGQAMPDVPPMRKACRVSPETGRFLWNRKAAATFGGIGAVAGICTGMLGVGGGFIIVPALVRYSELQMHSIVPTSLAIIFLVSASTVATTIASGFTITTAEWAFIAAVVTGMVAGRLISDHLPPTLLQRSFATLCAATALLMLIK